MNSTLKTILAQLFIGVLLPAFVAAQALDDSFTFQGRLLDAGSPANGIYNFKFILIDGVLGPVGTPQEVFNVQIADGLFTVVLDFGSGRFSGNQMSLQIGVRVSGEEEYISLGSQPLTAAPHAQFALDSATLGGLSTADFVEVAGDTMTGTLTVADVGLGGSVFLAGDPSAVFLHAPQGMPALGVLALSKNTTGSENAAVGSLALQNNTTGRGNTAFGDQTLAYNTDGIGNTAVGASALFVNSPGASGNTAIGYYALKTNSYGQLNTAAGANALRSNTTGESNVAIGVEALKTNTTGGGNIAIGTGAGSSLRTGHGNIFIGEDSSAVAESNTTRIGRYTQTRVFIGGIRGVTTDKVDAIPVVVDSFGQLGTVSSSRRLKKDIDDMGEASSRLLELRPVTFKYKQEPVQGTQPLQFGLIAEEVVEIFPDLVVYDSEGRPETVRYHLLSSVLLNELQKQHTRLEALEAKLALLVGEPPSVRSAVSGAPHN